MIKKIIEKKKLSVVCDPSGELKYKKFGGMTDINVEATDDELYALAKAISEVLNYPMEHAHEAAVFDLVEQQA